MHRWQKGNREQWLCADCSRTNAPLILEHGWKWQAEENDEDLYCDNCRCSDAMVRRHGRFRWLFCWIAFVLPWTANTRRLRAMRRAK